MIRIGIVGTNYGCQVQLPAFRLDRRCEVVALAGSDPARTAALARKEAIPDVCGDWRQMVERADIDAIAIATPPRVQPEIAIAALAHGKPSLARTANCARNIGSVGTTIHAQEKPLHRDFKQVTRRYRRCCGRRP